MPTPPVRDFPTLIRWLADKYHGGKVSPMNGRTGLSQALLDQWVKGQVKSPRLASLIQLAQAYSLDPMWVITLAAGPLLKRGARRLACVVGALGLTAVVGWGSAAASPTIPSEHAPDARDYVKRRFSNLRKIRRRGFPRLALVAGNP